MLAILCVSNSSADQTSRHMLLEAQGFQVTQTKTENAIDDLERWTFDLVIVDNGVSVELFRELTLAVPMRTVIFQLDAFTRPEDLLEKVRSATASNVTKMP